MRVLREGDNPNFHHLGLPWPWSPDFRYGSIDNIMCTVVDFETGRTRWPTYECVCGMLELVVPGVIITKKEMRHGLGVEEWRDIQWFVLPTKPVQSTPDDGTILANEDIPSELHLG
ncbi:uncharacterized protein ARMOST_18960 [Armillaria ostoyae]|uniref:Uncharacterized protein n=1 Tax=Armillaria ostoyae TaxID=47428 RepID=A0A284S369_ARMOS|nr:uncharacterized protein ARMOST_18960 [Armillaria ostoyae]